MNVRITDVDGRKPTFTQWDVDRILYIEGCEAQPFLHFANCELKRAIVVEAEADGSRWVCAVPNFILQFCKPMAVSVFLQPAEDEGKTVLVQRYDVRAKLKPQDYTYEENIGYVNWVAKSEEAQALLDAIDDLRQEIADAAEEADNAADVAGTARDQAVAAADGIDESIATALAEAKASGEFDGQNGLDGAPGPKGDPGNDGVSPDVSVTAITGGHRVTIVDADNTYVFDVMDGDDGGPGAKGDDGVSPAVTVTEITGGHRVAITDAQGTSTFDVMDGEKGDPGSGGDNVFWATYGTTTATEVGAALTARKIVAVRYVDNIYVLSYLGNLGSDRIYYFTNVVVNNVSTLSLFQSTWTNEGIQQIPPPSSSNPSAPGTAAPGTSSYYARADHVHPMPSAADVGALPATTSIPSKTSDLTNDSGFITGYTETDPTVPSWAKASTKPSYTASEVGAAPAVTEVTVSTAGAVTQALDAGKLYHFTGALTALTITLNAAPSGQLAQYHFDFNCGSTAPTVTIPSTVHMPDANSFEASKHYEVDILNNYGAVISWANS